MSKEYLKEIQSLEKRIEKLKQQAEREDQLKEALQSTFDSLKEQLDSAGISLDEFIKAHLKTFQRSMARIEKAAASESTPAPKRAPAKKRAAKKKATRGRRTKRKVAIKIPAGTYGNIPSAPDQVFEVKLKGPRPKLLKAYAEAVGLETLLEKHLVS